MYSFEREVSLYLSEEECNAELFKQFMKDSNLESSGICTEGIVAFRLIGRYLTIGFILELEDVLDSRIVVCSRYIGSCDTIKSLGLD